MFEINEEEFDLKSDPKKMFGIQGREKDKGKFKAFDYKEGRFVTNLAHQTMWNDKSYVEGLVSYMNKENPEYEFKVIERK